MNKLSEHYTVLIGKQSDFAEIKDTIIEAYLSDPAWLHSFNTLKDRMINRIMNTLGSSKCKYLIIIHNQKIVGVSGVAKEHETHQNLITGICISSRYQKKGLGKYLLNRSLVELREMGLNEAVVFTQATTIAAMKLYILFNSERQSSNYY